MELLVSVCVALGLCLLASLLYYLLLVPQAGRRLAACVALSLPLLGMPLFVPPDQPASALVRFWVAVMAVLYSWRMYDLHVGFSGRPPFFEYLKFMSPGVTHAVYRRLGKEPGPGTRGNLLRMLRGTLELVAGGAAVYVVWEVWDLGATSFALEHGLKWVALYPFLNGALLIAVAWPRLLGMDAMDVYRDPIVARTPADFWRRYNRIVGEWLFMNVFRRRALRGKPVRACLLVFFVSAVMHEYVFGMTLLKVQGYQFAFFMIHGVAVALTQRLKPKGWKAGVGIALTLAFTLATLVLFTASADQMLEPLKPFYEHGRPALWAD